MDRTIEGKRVAILAADGFEQAELAEPKKALEEAGAETTVVSLKRGTIKGWNENNWGEDIPVDASIDDCTPAGFDALMLPGGVMNPDRLRTDRGAVEFVTEFMNSNKPIGAICHGPWMLVESDLLAGRTLTSWPSLRTDIENAGGQWVDEEVCVDNRLVTSRKPDDIPAFSKKLIQEISEGRESL